MLVLVFHPLFPHTKSVPRFLTIVLRWLMLPTMSYFPPARRGRSGDCYAEVQSNCSIGKQGPLCPAQLPGGTSAALQRPSLRRNPWAATEASGDSRHPDVLSWATSVPKFPASLGTRTKVCLPQHISFWQTQSGAVITGWALFLLWWCWDLNPAVHTSQQPFTTALAPRLTNNDPLSFGTLQIMYMKLC